jgi:hypothetical protein
LMFERSVELFCRYKIFFNKQFADLSWHLSRLSVP